MSIAEKLLKSFEEYKETNDKRIADVEKGKGTAELEEKLEKQNEALSAAQKELQEVGKLKAANEEFEKRMIEMEKKAGRPAKDDGVSAEEVEYKNAFVGKKGFLRKGITAEIDALIETKSGSAYQGSDPDGGYAVPDGMDTNILSILRDMSPMRRLANVMQVGQARYSQLVNDGNAGSGWVGEVDPRPETQNPKLAKFTPYFGEIYANPAATQQSLDDIFFDVEDWYGREVAEAFSEKEGDSFIAGDGVNKPMGLLAYPTAATADGARAYGTLQELTTAAAGVLDGDDVIDLVYSLKSGYRQNGSFLSNSTTLAAIRKLKDSTGQYLWQPSLILGQPSTLAGYGIEEEEGMPDVASGAFSLAFGDIGRAYKILDVRGIRTLRDPYTNKPYVHFYTTKRVGGGVVDTRAVKLLKVQ